MVLKDGVEKKILENDKQNKEIVEGEHSELREPKADDVLSKGFLQFVVKSHPELVYEFFKENQPHSEINKKKS